MSRAKEQGLRLRPRTRPSLYSQQSKGNLPPNLSFSHLFFFRSPLADEVLLYILSCRFHLFYRCFSQIYTSMLVLLGVGMRRQRSLRSVVDTSLSTGPGSDTASYLFVTDLSGTGVFIQKPVTTPYYMQGDTLHYCCLALKHFLKRH